MGRLSIRWRLTLWYGAVVAVTLTVFSAAVYTLMGYHLLALTDAALAEELADLGGDIALCASANAIPRELGLRYASHEGYEFQVNDERGRVLFRSDGLGPGGLPAGRPDSRDSHPGIAYATSRVAGVGQARLVSRTIDGPDGPLRIQAAIALAPNESAMRRLLLVLALSGPLALAGALSGGYVLARNALAPVDRMSSAAAEITATRLDRRLEGPATDDELGRLARTFNDMISRLQRSFEEVRRFTADAAHELRTPLSVMRTEAEVALRAPRSPERDAQVLEDLLEEIDRLTRLVTKLLFLCREDAGLETGVRQRVRLDDLVRDVADHMQAVAREKGIALEVAELAACSVLGDVDRLRQLLFNLLDNAIKFTPGGGSVRVGVDRGGDGQARIAISDNGIGIGTEHLPRVFDRFYRVDPSRSRDAGGAGLGLAICRSIAEAHQGSLTVTSTPARGSTFRLSLPCDASPAAGVPQHTGRPRSRPIRPNATSGETGPGGESWAQDEELVGGRRSSIHDRADRRDALG
jgi:heavy metal sensor kinase